MLYPSAIKRYVSIMNSRGLPAYELLRGTGISQNDLATSDFHVLSSQSLTIVQNLLQISGDGGVGFDAGLMSTLPNLGPISHILMTCKNLLETHAPWMRFGEALTGISGKFNITNDDGKTVTLQFCGTGLRDSLIQFHVEELIGMVLVVSQSFDGVAIKLERATFSYPAPAHADRYQKLLDCAVSFNAARTELVVSRESVELRRPYYDEDINRLCIRYCENLLSRLGAADRTTAALRELFQRSGHAIPSSEQSAKSLKLSSRTLRRRLDLEGTSFRKELGNYRASCAKEYLKNNVSAKKVAFLLGFRDVSALRHAFKDWTGQTMHEFQRHTKSTPARVGESIVC